MNHEIKRSIKAKLTNVLFYVVGILKIPLSELPFPPPRCIKIVDSKGNKYKASIKSISGRLAYYTVTLTTNKVDTILKDVEYDVVEMYNEQCRKIPDE